MGSRPFSLIFWFEHSTLVFLSLAAAYHRRLDVLLLLLMGPAVVLTAVAVGQQLSADFSWLEGVKSYYSIAWLASLIAGGEYWCLFHAANEPR